MSTVSVLRFSLVALSVAGAQAAGSHAGHDHGGHGSTEMGSGEDATLLDILPTLPVCINGNWPLFKTQMLANMASSDGSSHAMTFGDYTLYMPDGSYPDKAMPGGGGHSGHNHRLLMGSMAMCPWYAIDASGVHSLSADPFCAFGNSPLYKTSALANAASPDGTNHPHMEGNFTVYMPDGVPMIHNADRKCTGDLPDLSMKLDEKYTVTMNTPPPSPPPAAPPPAAPVGLLVGVAAGVVVVLAGASVAVYFMTKKGKSAGAAVA